jgi:ATP-binding protein involved in chromosome partitioning
MPGLRAFSNHISRRHRDSAEAACAANQIGNLRVSLQEKISESLSRVINRRTNLDVLSGEMVRDVGTTPDGKVHLTLLMSAQDDATIAREVREAVLRTPGVSDVKIDIKDAAAAQRPPTPSGANRAGRALPVMGQEPQSQKAAVPAPTPVTYPELGTIIAVSSGKGGVGKSTVAVNLAIALAKQGKRVGLMDADVYGPNIPRMMGVSGPPSLRGELIVPHKAHGVQVMSIGFLIERDQPAIWRGPIIMKIITQFLRDVYWGQLDYLVVDMPPGTGDAQLSLVQATKIHGAVIVTTPQEVAAGDSLRGAKMFQRVDVPVLGIVENMSYFECPDCGKKSNLFGQGGGLRLANELGIPLLAEIPLYAQVLSGGDEGQPIIVAEPGSPAGKALMDLGGRIAGILAGSDAAGVNSTSA